MLNLYIHMLDAKYIHDLADTFFYRTGICFGIQFFIIFIQLLNIIFQKVYVLEPYSIIYFMVNT